MLERDFQLYSHVTIVILMLATMSAAAETEIHRCLLEDGTMAFQAMPCPESGVAADDRSEADDSRSDSGTHAANDDAFDFVNPFDEPASPPTPSEPTSPGPASKERAECEKTTRDAIDAIDLELRQQASTKEPSREHLAELLALTQQLRACKRL